MFEIDEWRLLKIDIFKWIREHEKLDILMDT